MTNKTATTYRLSTHKYRKSDGRKIEREVTVSADGLAVMLTAFAEAGIKVTAIRETR